MKLRLILKLKNTLASIFHLFIKIGKINFFFTSLGIILLPEIAVDFPKICVTVERKQKIVFQGRTGDEVTEEREVRIGISSKMYMTITEKAL